MGQQMKFDILSRFTGAVQITAEIECSENELTSVKLGLAVKWAIKSGADLGGADLGGAYLGEQWIIQGATRSDGYAFFLQKLKGDSEPMIKAGCRYFTLAQAESHWTATRGKTPLGRETEAIVRSMVSIAHIRGLMTEAKAVAA